MSSSYYCFIIGIIFAMSCGDTNQLPPPQAQTEEERRLPKFALSGLEVGEGLQAQLFAAEPLVRNPSNIDIDHLGRVWVVENVNYRPNNNPDNPYQVGGDQIAILTDTDLDGQADHRTTFFQDTLVDGAMGICVLDNKVILSTSPYIVVLTDVDRDDQADQVDTLFSGMGLKQGDHTVHAVSFGPDGRLYFNFGNAGGKLLDKDGQPVRDKFGIVVNDEGNPYRHGMAFRCELDGSNLEVLGHNFRNNYELAVDSYGSVWQSDNDDDGNQSVRINYVMEYGNFGYRDEKTGAAWQKSRSGMHPEISSRHWHQNDPGVVPNLLITGSGSPCGICVYEGEMLPARFHGHLMHADAGPGTLRAYPVKKTGAGYSASIDNLLVRKTDDWYRPTDIAVAPDGSVIGSDWYDPGVGGHLAGDPLRGRLYRLSNDKAYSCLPPDFSSPEQAVEALKSPNTATRYLAWTAIRSFDDQAEKALLDLWKYDNPRFRARALWLLGRIDSDHIRHALEDANPDIRLTAIRVARQLIPGQIEAIMKKMVSDQAPEVRREIAICLREHYFESNAEIWAQLASQFDGKDRWYLEALGIGASEHEDEYFQAWLEIAGDQINSRSGRRIIWRSRAKKAYDYLVDILKDPEQPAAALAPFLRAMDFHDNSSKNQRIAELLQIKRKDQAAFQQMALSHLSPQFAKNSSVVRKVVIELLPGLENTADYLDLVSQLDLKDQTETLLNLLHEHPNHEHGVRATSILISWDKWDLLKKEVKGKHKSSAITVLKHIWDRPAKAILTSVALDREQDMASRKAAIHSLGWDWGWEGRLKALLEDESLEVELKEVIATQLLMAPREADRQLGMSILKDMPGDRQAFASIQDLLQRKGDLESGKNHFQQNCSSCHQLDGEGIDFGPALSEIGNKLGKGALYSSIMYPSAGISHGFEGYLIKTKEGTTYSGYILGEDEQNVQIRLNGGISHNIAKSDIVSKKSMEMSLMTPNLHLLMGEDALVDLVEYLASKRNQATLVSNPYQGKIGYDRDEND